MLFKNDKGEIVELADDLTLQELADMGIDISLAEHLTDEPQDSWLHAANN